MIYVEEALQEKHAEVVPLIKLPNSTTEMANLWSINFKVVGRIRKC